MMMTLVTHAADLLMIAASLGAALYCLILSRRLSRLTSFDTGIGGAIAVLSAQVDEMKSALTEAKAGSDGAGQQLQALVGQAQEISGELELMIAACHDFAEEALTVQAAEVPPKPTLVNKGLQCVDSAPSADTGAPPDGMTPIFGTRRTSTPAQPMFRHRAAAQG